MSFQLSIVFIVHNIVPILYCYHYAADLLLLFRWKNLHNSTVVLLVNLMCCYNWNTVLWMNKVFTEYTVVFPVDCLDNWRNCCIINIKLQSETSLCNCEAMVYYVVHNHGLYYMWDSSVSLYTSAPSSALLSSPQFTTGSLLLFLLLEQAVAPVHYLPGQGHSCLEIAVILWWSSAINMSGKIHTHEYKRSANLPKCVCWLM